VSCRVDAEDISSVHVLEKAGFRLTDTLVKYVFNRRKHGVYQIKDLYKVRMFKDQDLPILMEIARTAFTKDRFHLDSTFSQEKADDFHARWIENLCLGQLGKRWVFVATSNNRPIGFFAFKLNEELERLTGYKIAGHALGAVLSKAKGAFPSLVKAAIQNFTSGYDCLEFDTQLNNYEILKIFQRFGFDFVRAQYTFHKNI
jgi:RimJ/RimL family protein N-acetyltransferase